MVHSSTPLTSTSRLNHQLPSLEEQGSHADGTIHRQRLVPSAVSAYSSDTSTSERAPLFPHSNQRGNNQILPSRATRLRAADVLGFVWSRLSAHQPQEFTSHVAALRDAYLALYPNSASVELSEPETRGVEEESKLWLARAEVGLLVLEAASECDVGSWAPKKEVQDRVDQAVGRGLVLVQKHLSLRSFKLPFTVASARLSVLENKPRQALALLRRQVATTLPTDPSAQIYRAHLALVSHLIYDVDASPALAALNTLADLAGRRGDINIKTLCKVERLRVLAMTERWKEALPALSEAEDALGLYFAADYAPPPPLTSDAGSESVQTSTTTVPPNVPAPAIPATPWQSALTVYTLMLGSMAWTHVGNAARTSARVAFMHHVMDARTSWEKDSQASRGIAWKFGIIDIPLGSTSDPEAAQSVVTIQSTHHIALLRLTFLATATSKRDPVLPASKDRDTNEALPVPEPKRRTFAREGLAMAEKPTRVDFAPRTPLSHARALQDSLVRMRAQFLLELVAVALSRHELDEAESRLAQLVAYLRNTKVGAPIRATTSTSDHDDTAGTLWPEFAPMVCLVTGNLAQVQLRPRRASASYRAAVALAGTDVEHSTTSLAARAADLALLIGYAAEAEDDWTPSAHASTSPSSGMRDVQPKPSSTTNAINHERDEQRWPVLLPPSPSEAAVLVPALLEHSSSALQAVGHVLAACTDTTPASSQSSSDSNPASILTTKNHLKSALELSTNAHDNALRAEVLTLTSALYVYTAPAYANVLLRRARELARELGASDLGSWVVRRIIEISKLNGKESRVPRLHEELAEFEGKTRQLRERPWLARSVVNPASNKQKR